MKKLFLPLLLLYIHIGALHSQSLSQRLDSLLCDPLLKTSEVGIAVYDLTEGKPLYQHQAEKLYRPASTQKVITSVTALSMLGKDYTLDTRLHTTGTITNDTLKGDLYLVGGLDPELMEADLDSLVEVVVRSGIRHITGSLVADVSMMDSVYWGPGWSWDDAPSSFQPYLSPLMLNRGCVEVAVSPTQKDSLPQVVCTPVSDFYRVENRAVSKNPAAGKLKITRDWLENGNRILISGNVERPVTGSLSVYTSKDFFLHLFSEKLKAKGMEVQEQSFGACPPESDTLFVLHRPIREVLKQALKESDNLCAESLFFHAAMKCLNKRHVGFEDGQASVKAWMKDSLACNPEVYRIADGSGVSLYNYVSPQLLLEYLKYAHGRPDIFGPLYESLPIAGVDGTLQHRMKKTAAHRRVHAKTGSVTGVSSLAGYARAANGHLLAFVIINQNVMKLREARAFQDRVCNTLCR